MTFLPPTLIAEAIWTAPAPAKGECDSDRFTSAVWYAWGRIDAAPDAPWFDAMAFASHYEQMARDSREGRISFLPSIQDVFKKWEAGQ